MAEIRVIKTINKDLFQNKYVTVKQCGNIFETVQVSRRNQKATIIKIDKERYCLLKTGEVKRFKHKDNRSENSDAVRRSLNRLKDYINTNVITPNNCLWITLTYAENMTDTKRLYKDFDKFIKRFRYAFGHCEYIVAMEPQGRGAWHAHLLAIYNNKAPYIPNSELANIWGNGFVKINLLKDIDNIGLYLTAYLGDMEINNLSGYNGEKIKNVKVKGITKRILKGGRLKLYPTGFNLYRISKGIKKPSESLILESKLLEIVKDKPLKYERILEITLDGDIKPIYIHYRTYYIKEKKRE